MRKNVDLPNAFGWLSGLLCFLYAYVKDAKVRL